MTKRVLTCKYCHRPFIDHTGRNRNYCSAQCFKQDMDEITATAVKWLRLGWTNGQLKQALGLTPYKCAKLRKQHGIAPGKNIPRWSNSDARRVLTQLEELKQQFPKSGGVSVFEVLCPQLGLTVDAIKKRVHRYRKRCQQSVNPKPKPRKPPKRPARYKIQWSDEKNAKLLAQVDALPRYGAFATVARELGVSRNTIIGRLHRYRKRLSKQHLRTRSKQCKTIPASPLGPA